MATKGRPWTPAQRKNFLATAAKKRAAKLAGKDETPRMHSIPLSAIPDKPVKQAVKKGSIKSVTAKLTETERAALQIIVRLLELL